MSTTGGSRVSVGGVPSRWVDVLSVDECWELLAATEVGRLAVDIAGQPDIFPINFVVAGRTIVFRSGAGTKLAGAVLGRHVAIEIDGVSAVDRSAWSVVVKGTAHEIARLDEWLAADDLPLYPWTADPKPNFVRIEAELVTGRRFHVVQGADLAAYCRQVAELVEGGDDESLAVTPAPGLEYHPGAPELHPD